MRRLATFILRLWVDSENCPASYEGQIEYVATGEHTHIRSEEDVIHFIHERIRPGQDAENSPNCDEYSSAAS